MWMQTVLYSNKSSDKVNGKHVGFSGGKVNPEHSDALPYMLSEPQCV